jgi:hypothetical protein
MRSSVVSIQVSIQLVGEVRVVLSGVSQLLVSRRLEVAQDVFGCLEVGLTGFDMYCAHVFTANTMSGRVAHAMYMSDPMSCW